MNKQLLNELLTAVNEQIATENPKEAKTVYETLLARGLDEKKAKENIAKVIYQESINIMTTQEPFSRDRYVHNLLALLDDVEAEIEF